MRWIWLALPSIDGEVELKRMRPTTGSRSRTHTHQHLRDIKMNYYPVEVYHDVGWDRRILKWDPHASSGLASEWSYGQ
ncbi:hypothetical protein PISMIDRAFT_169266 [Pisolithus microcarpus 441]|uniref:Uncharacterized protein n=1 Tax=Pisolithus microcarpus 441 TaxID=765257 RepID=A0A0C9YYF2_9AGAM|nr:hypothetical protein PISMIDRAFT_169266 [Pisolithus microcarpus 441]